MNRSLESVSRCLGLGGLALVLLACPSESPTEPRQDSMSPGGDSSGSWTISVTSTQGALETNGGGATLTIRVRRAVTNELPPDGATVSLSTTLGAFVSPGSGQSSGFVSLAGGLAEIAFFPGNTAGNAIIEASLESSTGQLTILIEQGISAEFFVTSVVPAEGSTAGGDTVEVVGSGFAEPLRVFFGSTPVEVLGVTNATIEVLTPAGSSGFVDIEVQINFGSSGQESFTFTSGFRFVSESQASPSIFSIDPAQGPNEGGTRVTILGDGFEDPVQVFFGGIQADARSVSPMQIVVTTPPAKAFGEDNSDAVVDVEVVNVGSGRSGALSGSFRYGSLEAAITAVDPFEGAYNGATAVSIFGHGFAEPLIVEYGGERQQVLSVRDDEIRTRSVGIRTSTCADVTGETRVTFVETGQVARGRSFVYLVRNLSPEIEGISPTRISATGTPMTIMGRHLRNALVEIGGRAVPTLSTSRTSIHVTSPSFGDSFFDTETCDDGSEGLVETNADVVVENPDTTCRGTFVFGVIVEPPAGKTC